MTMHFGYIPLDRRQEGGDTKPFTGGKMESDIDMNNEALKNVAAPTDNADAISKQVLENYLTKYREKSRYETVFDINININRAVANNGIIYHNGSNQIKRVKDGVYNLHQDKDGTYGPTLKYRSGLDYHISSDTVNVDPLYMALNCPSFVRPDISVFIVLKRTIKSTSEKWEYIIGNDNGSYDKYIAYKNGSTTELSYGGGFPVNNELTCTIPNNIDTTQKHLISCHWLMSGSHVRVNNVVSTDSSFISNWRHVGDPYSSIFANERRTKVASNPLTAELYGLRIVSGFLEPGDIDTISQEMMVEFKIP